MKNTYNLTVDRLLDILNFSGFVGHRTIVDGILTTEIFVKKELEITFDVNNITGDLILMLTSNDKKFNELFKKYHVHQLRLRQAYETASKSSCVSRQVGALIVRDDRIISEGYNGTPKGFINCCDVFNEVDPSHHEWSNIHEIHAEMNSILWAARKGISVEGGIMYSTTKPCLQCTKNIIASGINEIYFCEHYPRNDNDILDKFLNENGVLCKQIKL
jgi:dCMP deaminase